ncbi:MAG: Hydroxyacylglutathione hydrolase [Gemmataceae bacterium]|nr:Hydroxyacylglutathione hydrolase [Gemmataceae bacterium]
MRSRALLACLSAAAVVVAAWLSQARPEGETFVHWEPVAPGVYRTKDSPHGYAVVSGKKAVLIDAPVPPDVVAELRTEAVEVVLLTHHHRDTAAFASAYRAKGVPVRAAKEATDWLTPEGVAKYWKESIPLRNSRTAYFVLPEGVPGVDCTLEDGKPITFGGWQITPIATPGHSRDHLAFRLRPAADKPGPDLVFCGDAFHSAGKMWAPFTTDWDHWTDVGLKPTAESLRKLAKLPISHLCPAHGPVVTREIPKALTATAEAVEEAGFMKSFERFTKQRLGDAPKYPFLVPKEQVASAGDKPWAKVADHLWITGNTYVLKAKDGDGILVLDPWGQGSADQVEKLRKEEKLGPVEVVGFSHAHYDHFDGIHVLNGRDRCEVWGLDLVALPLKDPLLIRAPFLDPRPIRFTKELKDGQTAAWGGYTFKFHHLPGQSWFSSGIETTIDGKRCVFTADNFFHQDQFSGTGGWMGLNRSSPVPYGTSAKKVLDIAPEWVLAEHGGPYVFSAEDYRRRVKWGEAAGKVCDALCVSGSHLRDWTPHRVSVGPVLITATPAGRITVGVTVDGSGSQVEEGELVLAGRGVFPNQSRAFRVNPGQRWVGEWKVDLPARLAPGRYVFAIEVRDSTGASPADPFVAVDIP